MKRLLSNIAFALAISAASIPAVAQWTVMDPINLIQNFISATSEVATEINNAKSLIEQTKTAVDMAKSVKGLKDVQGLADMQASLKLYKDLQRVDGSINKDFQAAIDINERLAAQYGASDFSWAEFLNSRDQLSKQQRESAAQRYNAVNASLEQNARQRQAIVQQLATVQGQTEAMQTVGAAIDVLIGQNQQMISILATNNRVAETNALTQDADAKAANAHYNAYQKGLRDAAAKYKK